MSDHYQHDMPKLKFEPKDDGDYDEDSMDDISPRFEIDKKDLLIVKDGTIRVAESLEQQEHQQFDANGEVIKATGTWTKVEHERFLKAMEIYPKGPWKSIAEMVGTRTVRQTQTHAQKYREKMARRMRGLRNRNGTLQYPPTSIATTSTAAAAGYSTHAASKDRPGYVLPPEAMAVPSRQLLPPSQPQVIPRGMMTSLAAAPAIAASRQPVVVMTPSSAEFNQLSKTSISRAFLGNLSYPVSWEADHPHERKAQVPNFDESMDFLMNMYHADPNQLGKTSLPDEM